MGKWAGHFVGWEHPSRGGEDSRGDGEEADQKTSPTALDVSTEACRANGFDLGGVGGDGFAGGQAFRSKSGREDGSRNTSGRHNRGIAGSLSHS